MFNTLKNLLNKVFNPSAHQLIHAEPVPRVQAIFFYPDDARSYVFTNYGRDIDAHPPVIVFPLLGRNVYGIGW